MTPHSHKKQQEAHQVSHSQAQAAGVSHVKLQQMQDEYLKWLDTMTHDHPDVDGYAYKKVR